MSQKIIHYCWFGGKPLPKLAKKCIKSWKKYLPDYKIMRWDESNFDVNVTKFSQWAYKQKKWAFVSDVARIYALKEYGGIYFDTDMLVVNDIEFLLNDEVFVGWESKDFVAVGVLGVKKPHHPLIEDLWEKYQELSFVSEEKDMYSISIPQILTGLLINKYGLKSGHLKNQKLKKGICVYSRDYFYPLSFDRKDNMFTENTCMIHYYNASWVSSNQKLLIKLYRTIGRERGEKLVRFIQLLKGKSKKLLKIVLFPLVILIRKIRHRIYLRKRVKEISLKLDEIGEGRYIVIYNPDWLGVSNATRELFPDNVVELEEVFFKSYLNSITNLILKHKPKAVVFSGFAAGWQNLAMKIKASNKKIELKVIWHGGNSLNIESYDWAQFREIFFLYNSGIFSSIAFVKKSLAEFYQRRGYKTEFVMNNFSIKNKDFSLDSSRSKNRKEVRIGLYGSSDRWVKNFYNQLSAASLIEGAVVDCIPLNRKTREFADIVKVKISGEGRTVSRKELLKRMGKNDINLYVTYSECAPMIPLESFELGVPCITGNNHHYWENSKLKDFVVVDKVDDPIAIYEKIMICLENREEVLRLYSEWKEKYDKEVLKNVKNFLN